jgi:predicted small integral membrane protein
MESSQQSQKFFFHREIGQFSKGIYLVVLVDVARIISVTDFCEFNTKYLFTVTVHDFSFPILYPNQIESYWK